MATTEKGIYYPSDYSEVADIPKDMKDMAESTDVAIENSKYDDTEIRQDIDEKILELKTDLENTRNMLPTNTASGSSIIVNDSANYKLKKLELDGNTYQAQLPATYQQVDYIESSGTQYIDTGYIFDNDTEMSGEFQYVSLPSSGNATIFGMNTARNMAGAALVEATNNKISMYVNVSNHIDITGDTNKHSFVMQGYNVGKLLKIDNTTGTAGNISASRNIEIFRCNTTDTSQYNWTSGRIYNFKMIKNGFLVRNLIPCYRKSDNEVGLYDLVSNTFLTNQGTGTFTYGTTVSNTPSPDHPQEVVNVGSNVNLFDGILGTSGYYTNTGFIYYANARASKMEVEANTNYALSTSYINGFYNYLAFLDENSNFISAISYTSPNGAIIQKGYSNDYFISAIFTTPSNCKYIGVGMLTTNDNVFIKTVKLEKGRYITGYTPYSRGGIDVLVQNKNLFDKNREINSTYISPVKSALLVYKQTGKYAKGYIDSNNEVLLQHASYNTAFVTIESGKTYTLKYTGENGNFAGVNFLDKEGNTITASNRWLRSYTHTATSEEKYILCSYFEDPSSVVQIEESSTATTYVEHQQYNVTLPLPEGMELCKIGNYKDTIFKNIPSSEYYDSSLVEGGWYKKNEIGKMVLDGTENFTYNSSLQAFVLTGVNVNQKLTGNLVLSNYFIRKEGYSSFVVGIWLDQALIIDTEGSLNGTQTATQFKTWLSDNKPEIYYVLATPTYTQITDTNFINLAENIYTYTGVTHIDCTDEIKPTFNIEYYQDIKTLINNLQAQILS